MAEERIDVEVTDKVDNNVAKKMHAIADGAERADNYVNRLKNALANVNTSSVDKLVSAMARADSAQAKLLNAQVRLSAAQDTGAIAAAKLATQQQKLATEAARTEAATARAAAASAAAESASLRLAAAQGRVTATSSSTATSEEQLAAAVARAKAQFDAGEISIRGYVAALQQARAASTGAAVPIVDTANHVEQSSRKLEAAQSRTRSSNANIIAQLQDIGVSLAGGQNPLLVLIQQGSQLDYIARTTANGWAGLTMQIVRMLAPLAAVAAAIGVIYAIYKNFTSEMATRNKPALEEYAKTLGLTSKEMKKLSNETAGAGGKLKEFDVVTITAGDSWNGFIATVMKGLSSLVDGWGVANDYIAVGWQAVLKFAYAAFLGFYASVLTLVELIAKTALNVGKIAINAILLVANSVVMVIQDVVNVAIGGLNLLAAGANGVMSALGFETVIPQIDKVDLGIKSVTQGMLELSSIDIGATFQSRLEEAHNTIQGFAQEWENAATAAAKARLAALAAAIIQNRGPGAAGKVDKTAERRALAIGMVNLKLDDELARMRMLKDERAIQQRMDQIEEQLAQKKITLNEKERASILAKVRAIEEYKYVQAESDRIYEEATAPLRTMNATVEAATALYDQGAISLEKYTEQLRLATRTYNESTDPLFSYNEAIDSALKTTGLYGIELDKANYLETVRQDLARQGKSIYDANTGALTAEVQALVAKNDALRQQQFIQGQLGAVLDPILNAQNEVSAQAAVYAELQRLREQDKISEEAYQQAKLALWIKYNEARLNTASDFFGTLASITKHGTGVVGAISKAAAVAQATIDGFVATQKALASAPPPWNYVAAAAVALRTGANVAGIISANAGSFANGGQFMVEGKSGVDANNINMNVTRGERVTVETPAQQRANDAGTGQAPTSLGVKIVNAYDPDMILAEMDSDEGDEIIFNALTRNPNRLDALIKGSTGG